LSEDEIVDALEERGSASLREHLASCGDCAAALAFAKDGFALARDAEVPEPSPLYWEAFRRQVDRRIGAEAPPRPWAWLLPLAAAAAVAVVALPLLRSRLVEHAPVDGARLAAWSSLPPADEDDGLAVLQEVSLAESDLVSVRESRSADDVLTDLSDEETTALAEALRHELKANRL